VAVREQIRLMYIDWSKRKESEVGGEGEEKKRIVSHFQIPAVCTGMFAVNKTARDCTHNKYTASITIYFCYSE